MFDMNKSTDRRQVLAVLVMILVLSCIPALLVFFSHVAWRLIPGALIGIVLYFIFLRKGNSSGS